MASSSSELSPATLARIEKNREKAISLQQARLTVHPYSKQRDTIAISTEKNVIKIQGTKYIDSGGGFLIEKPAVKDKSTEETEEALAEVDTAQLPLDYDECADCGTCFADSILLREFGYSVCDGCRDPDGKHCLITRTEAKAEFLLQDCDFDKREPALKYISRKNPHNPRWGEMKLYLLLKVKERAMEIWGSEEAIEEEKEKREAKREITKVKKYNKQLKALRMDVRSSLYDKTTTFHTHSFMEEEVYNEEDDTYTRKCETCGHEETYEKL